MPQDMLIHIPDGEQPTTGLRVKLFFEGDKWGILFGEDVHRGVAGFGRTPAMAITSFLQEWKIKKPRSSGYPHLQNRTV